ncbi:uncharacterized protein LOC128225880 [Mya arenaria]|uniref:uncharacterized protein LOC128225847 n=1 Tax=Mya arenaria TaxID=6604 RepID=UPI0022DFEABC|nr:uncharacterized protein LOC128225847 [Mya arenaria]XP_052791739.1 uncharacterized protein LOC128225880 [Mya arenaria]
MKSANLLLHRTVCMCVCLCRIITYSSGNDIIANNKNVAVYQSTTFDTCLASNVKNNLTLRKLDVDDALLCQTCSATAGNESPWLQIDFSKKTLMRYMRIYGRDLDSSGQSNNILLSISNTSHFVNQNFSMWEDVDWINASDPFKGILLDFGDTRVLQYLVFRRPWPSVMAICEVEVLNTDCGNGFFGDKCANVCRCKDKQPCDSVTGKCSTPGCFAGWQGDSCSKGKSYLKYHVGQFCF